MMSVTDICSGRMTQHNLIYANAKTEIARKLLAEPATASLSDERIENLTGLPGNEICSMR